MADLWPGEAEIMEQHEWRMSEAPTTETLAPTREYPKPAAKKPYVLPSLPTSAAVESSMTKRERKKACRKAGYLYCTHGYPDPRGSICGPAPKCNWDYCPEYRAYVTEQNQKLAHLASL